MELIVAVGTKREGKLTSVRMGGERAFPHKDIVLEAYGVDSGVSNQPMSLEEMYEGARNRAQGALNSSGQAHFGVGIESGLSRFMNRWFDSGMVVVLDRNGQEGVAESVKLEVGQRVMELIRQGLELSDAVERTSEHNTMQSRECFAALTGNALNAIEAYADAVASAASRFTQPQFFD